MHGLTLQRENFADVFGEALPLLQAHWAEVARFKDIPLNVDTDAYLRAEETGHIRIYTARVSGELVGYAAFVLGDNAHYRTLDARQDALYVAPTVRGAFIGLRLVRFCDMMLAAEGVIVASHHVKLAHPALGAILKRSGYEQIETIWGKRLDTDHPPTKAEAGEAAREVASPVEAAYSERTA